VWDVLDSNQ